MTGDGGGEAAAGIMAAVLVTALLTALVGGAAGGVTVHYLHWNSSNPIFRIDNTDHIVDVNQGTCPQH